MTAADALFWQYVACRYDGLNVNQTARKLGVDPTTLRRWIRGRWKSRLPASANVALAVAQAFEELENATAGVAA